MNVREQIRSFILTNFYVADPADLADDASLLDYGVVDSTGVLEIVAYLEDTFQVAMDDAEVVPDNLDSIARISAYLDRKIAARAPSLDAARDLARAALTAECRGGPPASTSLR